MISRLMRPCLFLAIVACGTPSEETQVLGSVGPNPSVSEFGSVRTGGSSTQSQILPLDFEAVLIGETRNKSQILGCYSPITGFCQTILTPKWEGADVKEFSPLVRDDCTGKSLANDETCSYDFSFTPSRPKGSKTAALVLSDDQDIPYLRIELNGEAITGLDYLITAGTDFGKVPVASSSGPQEFAIINGAQPLTIFGVNDCKEFKAYAQTSDFTLAPGEELRFSVFFTPSYIGRQVCYIRFSASDENLNEERQAVKFIGRGIAP